MKTLLRFAIVPAILVGLALSLHAQGTGAERETGKVLLLKNGNVMEGDIKKVGAQWCIRRGTGEIWLAHDKATRLCADWDEAVAFAQTFIKLDSAIDRVTLARWCHLHGLNDHALEQAKIALELQPNSGDAKQIVTILERAKQEPPAKPVTPKPVVAAKPSEPAPTVDVTAETIIAFANRVQPILMNKCASCHATGFGGKFVLERVAESGVKSSTQRNLAAVLPYIDLDRPAISLLLVKAITPHGDSNTPPLRDRSSKPFQSIQQWQADAIRANPQLYDYHAAKKVKGTPSDSKNTTFGSQRSAAEPMRDNVAAPSAKVEVKATPTETSAPVQPKIAQAPVTQQPREWCDPEIFNEWVRSQQSTAAAAPRER